MNQWIIDDWGKTFGGSAFRGQQTTYLEELALDAPAVEVAVLLLVTALVIVTTPPLEFDSVITTTAVLVL